MAEGEKLVIIGLHHAQITVPEGREDDARAFYCGVLGLSEAPKPASLTGRGGFWLQVGERQVHVGTEAGVDRAATTAHLAYQVRGLDAWRQRLAQRGIQALDSIPIPGYDRFEFRDPFGNRIELVQAL